MRCPPICMCRWTRTFSYAQSYEPRHTCSPCKTTGSVQSGDPRHHGDLYAGPGHFPFHCLGQEYSGGTARETAFLTQGLGDIPVRLAEGPGRRGNLSGDRLVLYHSVSRTGLRTLYPGWSRTVNPFIQESFPAAMRQIRCRRNLPLVHNSSYSEQLLSFAITFHNQRAAPM